MNIHVVDFRLAELHAIAYEVCTSSITRESALCSVPSAITYGVLLCKGIIFSTY